MKVKLEYPPNINAIDAKFHIRGRQGILFTYGNIIYNPTAVTIPIWIEKHEELHAERQYAHGPEWWWEQYLKDSDFRYEEELKAHQVEYQVWCEVARSRNERRLGLKTMAKRLSSDIYGNCVDFETAKWNIKNA